MMVNTYNPNYLGSRDRRIVSLRPALAKVAARSYLKIQNKSKRARMEDHNGTLLCN
jgi:hypothetical protein